jgi:hypothetical protein
VLIQEWLGRHYSRFIAICTDAHGRRGDTIFVEQEDFVFGHSELTTTCAAPEADLSRIVNFVSERTFPHTVACGARSARFDGGGTRRAPWRLSGMVHPLLASSEFHGAALTALVAVFEGVCRELNLHPVQDPLTDIVAETVLHCVRDGKADQVHILNCARKALNIH